MQHDEVLYFLFRSKNLCFMTKHMGAFLKELSRTISMAGKAKTFFYNFRYGNYLVTVLLFIKCCYLLNVIAQITMLNFFLRTKYTFYGMDILERYATRGLPYPASGLSFRVVLLVGKHVSPFQKLPS